MDCQSVTGGSGSRAGFHADLLTFNPILTILAPPQDVGMTTANKFQSVVSRSAANIAKRLKPPMRVCFRDWSV